MNAEINAAFAQDGLTSDERAQKREWQDIQDALKISLAKANAANASKDYSSADYHTKEVEAIMKQATDYYAATKDLRARYNENLTPSEKAQQLQTQINDIKTQIETEAIKNEEKAYAEYAGQNMSVAQARVGDIELQAKFGERKLIAKENALLRELGLEQEAQKMEQASIEKQLSWLADDYAVAQKVEDRITASEEKVYEKAQSLEKEAKDTLITILDGLQGTNPSEMSQESIAQLQTLAARSGIPYNLVEEALKTQYQKSSFDQAIQLATQTRLSGGGASTVGTVTEQLYSGLSSSTATAVRAKVGKFSTEPLVQNFATIQDGYNFASSLSDTTKNPADDQALIYSLAKALDPGSVVREGEYATAQKYAQSWIQAYGKGIEQALAGTGFLSETARKNIKATIKQKYESSQRSYDQIVKSYETGINNLTGRGDGSQFLTDYVTPEQTQKYEPGTTFANDGILYLVGDDGETITPIANYAG